MAGCRAVSDAPAVVRYCPSTDLLNLLFGLLAGISINLVTSIALDSSQHSWRIWFVAIALLLAAVCVGGLAVVTGRVKEETTADLGSTISASERRAELQAALTARKRMIAFLECLSGSAVLLSMIIAFT
jgi:hypothetical protein